MSYGDKGRDSSIQKRISHIYTLILSYSRISILYKKNISFKF